MIIYDIYYYNIIIRGGTVQLFHSSVRITVLESRFRYGSVCLGKILYCQIKIENKNNLSNYKQQHKKIQ